MTLLTQFKGNPLKIAAALTCAALIVGCSDDDDPAPTYSPSSQMSSMASSSAAMEMNIAETATANGSFSILLKAATEAGLGNILSETPGLTVFAPTDDAFLKAGIDAAAIDAMSTEEINNLAEVLKYHVYVGADGAVDATTALTLGGARVDMFSDGDAEAIFTVLGESLFINNAKVIIPDVMATNGIIHVIDTVIMPPMPTTIETTIAGAVQATDSFSRLLAEVDTAGLVPTLSDANIDYTVFAPNNDAFAKIGDDVIGDRDILLYHVIPSPVDSLAAFNSNGQSVATAAAGDTVDVNIVNGDLYVNASKVIGTDIMLDNGIVHTVDTVIMPPVADTVADVVINNEDFSTLEVLVGSAGLVDDLQTEGASFTVFAPTDAAFTALSNSNAELYAELQTNSMLLESALLYHVFDQKRVFSPEAIAASGGSLMMMNGAEVAVELREDGLYINDSKVETTDILTRNGVIHVIDAVLIPPMDM